MKTSLFKFAMTTAFIFGFLNARANDSVIEHRGDDVRIIHSPLPAFAKNFAPPTDCREAISREICLVDKEPDDSQFSDRPCLPTKVDYVAAFEKLYDRFPAHLQEMFCHISRIYIEKDFIGSAYASLFVDASGKAEGGILGIREEFFSQPSSISDWASWKEQVPFGVEASHVNARAGLPHVSTTFGSDSTDMLYFLVAHEFGHHFDFANQINHASTCTDFPGRNDCARVSWHSFSWQNNEVPLPAQDFPLRPSLCSYFCEGKFIPAARQSELYRDLSKTNFLTPYATRFEMEDFADTFAVYTIATERHAAYRIQTDAGPDNVDYDVTARLKSEDLRGKREFIQSFLKSSYIYPGPQVTRTKVDEK